MKLPKSTINRLTSGTVDERTDASPTVTASVQDTASNCAQDVAQNGIHTSAHKTRPPAPLACHHARGTDLNARATEHELAILHWIARFGWLTSAQLAQLVWRRAAIRMTQTTLARSLIHGEVVRHVLPNGIPAYFITKRGAHRLASEAGWNDPKPTNRTYKRLIEACNRTKQRTDSNTASFASPNRHQWQHRMLVNWTCIWAREHGYECFTEHEIAQGRAPFYSYLDKIPDALLVGTDDGGEWLLWVEVEHSRRSARDRQRLAAWVCNMYPELWRQDLLGTGGSIIGGILFVIPSDKGPLLTAIQNALLNTGTSRQTERLMDIAADSSAGGVRYVQLAVTPKLGCGGFDGPTKHGFVLCGVLDVDAVEALRDRCGI